MPGKKTIAKTKKGAKPAMRTDIASVVTFTIKSAVGSTRVDATMTFNPPIPGPAAEDQRLTPAQSVAASLIEALSGQITNAE